MEACLHVHCWSLWWSACLRFEADVCEKKKSGALCTLPLLILVITTIWNSIWRYFSWLKFWQVYLRACQNDMKLCDFKSLVSALWVMKKFSSGKDKVSGDSNCKSTSRAGTLVILSSPLTWNLQKTIILCGGRGDSFIPKGAVPPIKTTDFGYRLNTRSNKTPTSFTTTEDICTVGRPRKSRASTIKLHAALKCRHPETSQN